MNEVAPRRPRRPLAMRRSVAQPVPEDLTKVVAEPDPAPEPVAKSAASRLEAAKWAEVVRLRTLPAALAPVLAGSGVAGALGRFDAVAALLAALVALALQIGCNLANDYSDGIRGTDDERTGPARLTASGLVEPVKVKRAAFGCFGAGALFGLILVALSGTWWLIAVGVAAVAAAWFYTGGAKPYGYLGLGEVFVFVFFGLVATAGTTYTQAHAVPWWGWLAAVGVGLIACSLLMVNNLRDIETDPAHGKRTLAVRLGYERASRLYQVMLFTPLALGLATLWGGGEPGGSLGVLAAVSVVGVVLWGQLALLAWRPVAAKAKGRELIGALKMAGIYELVYGLSLGLALLAV